MGCIYNGVHSSLVALFLWLQVTNIAVVMAHCGYTPIRYGTLSELGLFSDSLWVCVIWGKYVSLIWSYIWQEVRKCSSVSTSFCGQCAHSLTSLESQVCLQRPLSIARLCSLSLYIVKVVLNLSLALSYSHVRRMTLTCFKAEACQIIDVMNADLCLFFKTLLSEWWTVKTWLSVQHYRFTTPTPCQVF